MARPVKPYTPKTDVAKRMGEFFQGETFLGIAKKVGVAGTSVAMYMRGEAEPPMKMLQYIAENGGDVTYILSGVPAPAREREAKKKVNVEFQLNVRQDFVPGDCETCPLAGKREVGYKDFAFFCKVGFSASICPISLPEEEN